MNDKFEYRPVYRSDRWMIEATDQDGEITYLTCGQSDRSRSLGADTDAAAR